MAVGSFVQVTSGVGPKLATGPTYTENSNVVQDEKVIVGEPYLAAYTVTVSTVSTATTNSHLLQIMAGSSNKVRIKSIIIQQSALVSVANTALFSLLRLSSAGTGGTAITPMPMDGSDPASNCTAMTLPTVKGTEIGANVLWTDSVGMVAAHPMVSRIEKVFNAANGFKPIVIQPGTSNGICVKMSTGMASGTLAIYIEVIENSF